jgi:pSer/pThr/pTyr-binding forkhead associated (FHA) protein
MTLIGTWPSDLDAWRKISFPFRKKPFLTWIHEDVLIGSRPAIGQKTMPIPGTSQPHARIFEQDMQWYLEDLGSDQGTWLLDTHHVKQRLLGRTLIFHDMTVLLGITVVRFELNTSHSRELMPISK